MPKILITGGAGFIASALAKKLSENPKNEIVIVDNLLTGSLHKIPKSLNDNIRFVKCDVNRLDDISGVFYSNAFDYVFHYAALVGVQRTLANPVSVLEDISGVKNILNLSKNTGVKRVYYSSSSEVYGEPVEIPQNEQTTPLNSRLPYAIVKNLAEAYLRAYNKEYGLEYTIFRFFNTYGPGQSSDFVMTKFIKAALAGEPITIFGDGKQTRTFCYIDDNIEATARIFEEGLFINDVINIGSDDEVPIRELANVIIQISNSKSAVKHLDPLEEGDMQRRCPDNSKMRQVLQVDLMPLEKGISILIDKYKSKEHVRV